MKRTNKRGLSPVITTVLLIAIATILAIIILLWARLFIPQAIIKNGTDIKKVCEDVSFEADYISHAPLLDEIIVSNTGNVNIYSFSIEEEIPGRTMVTEKKAQDIATGNEIELGNGGSGNFSITLDAGTKTIIIKPVLLGSQGEWNVNYTCVNHEGVEIEI